MKELDFNKRVYRKDWLLNWYFEANEDKGNISQNKNKQIVLGKIKNGSGKLMYNCFLVVEQDGMFYNKTTF